MAGDVHPRLYSSTEVISGFGKAEVTDCGMCTQVGLIAKRLGQNKSISEKNPLMSAVNKLASYLALLLALVIVCATLVAFWTKYQDPQKPCAEKDEVCFLKTAVLRAVVMSVALIPHGLPFICTVMLYVTGRWFHKFLFLSSISILLTRRNPYLIGDLHIFWNFGPFMVCLISSQMIIPQSRVGICQYQLHHLRDALGFHDVNGQQTRLPAF